MITQTAIVPGSLSAIARQNNLSIAETFVNADVIVIVDTSGSMHACDSRDNQSRYQVALQELANLQATMPGKIAVIAFSDQAAFCPGGQPIDYGGGTDMAKALRFAKVADVDSMRFILISDGAPRDEEETLRVARTYQNRIDTIYVGPEDDMAGCRTFLETLAKVSGGRTTTADRAKELVNSVRYLLAG